MKTLFGLTEMHDARPPAPEKILIFAASAPRTTDALLTDGGRAYTPSAYYDRVRCSHCGQSVAIEAIRAHRCEVG